ncbi:MAG: murein biosynthesis integral membrane protein MurJ [Actinomycetota bacterium]
MSTTERAGAGSLARGAAQMTIATAISRATGFIRVVVVAAALGTTFLANTYQTANTAPNILFELVAAGVLTSVFVPTFVEYLVQERREEGWEAANALTSVAAVGLVGLFLILALAAPVVMRVLTLGVRDAALRGQEVAVGATFLRLFAPQVIFYGAGMIMTSALQAHRRFAMPAIAPIFNNIIVIAVYLIYAAMRGSAAPTVAGITTAQKFVLGAGTTAGVIAMTLCLIPGLMRLGWRFRFNFDINHPAVRRGARLGIWALSYAGGYQAGLIVVLVLANRIQGGVAAYQWAYTFFYLPYALFGFPIFSVLFTAMSEHVALQDHEGLLDRVEDGMRMLVVVLIPISAAMIIIAEPLTQVTLRYGVMTTHGATLVAHVLIGFAIGLPTYSAFLTLTRGYYAQQDARTPALVNIGAVAIASVSGVLLFFALPKGWAVTGLSLGHSIGFGVGAVVLGWLFARSAGNFLRRNLRIALKRSVGVTIVASIAMVASRVVIPASSRPGALANVVVTLAVGGALYAWAMLKLGSPELERVRALVGRIRVRSRG